MSHQHRMPVHEGQVVLADAQAREVDKPRHLRISVGKHFNLSVSLSVSPAFLTFMAAIIGAVGGNYWFLL
ncbi:hypothetical protein [Streptomyces sp. NPDC058664]|uniref:hypothetical protein n=1 Tax=unclassified Streptomyces TaxID=2593676 RepID=UPI00366730D3